MTEETQAPAPSHGIKESLEVIEGLKVVLPAGVEIAADGKLSAKDIKPVVDAIKKYDVIVAAVKDSSFVLKEGKDYDQAELAQVGLAFVGLLPLIKDAYVRGK